MAEPIMPRKYFYGTGDNDSFVGTTVDDTFYGYNGDDWFLHSRGNDVFDGGGDTDTVSYRQAEADSTRTHGVIADLATGVGDDGEGGKDSYVSIENVEGSDLADSLYGDQHDNVLTGWGGRDYLYGRGGQDTLVAQVNDAYVDGGSETDTLVLQYGSGLTTVTLNNDGTGSIVSGAGTVQLKSIENVTIQWALPATDPYDRNVVVTGNNLDNVLHGSDFVNDIIDGGDGWDVLIGGRMGYDGVGRDTFVFHHGSAHPHQHEQIMDFRHGEDVIDLRDTPVQDFQDLFTPGDRFMEDNALGVLIHTSVSADTSIQLFNVHVANLTQSDFLF
jgi:Ca2+-binding RTX toxin-like protein